jgi:hypothetical protein
VPTRLLGWLAALLATLITLALVLSELTDAGQRRWWAARPLTTDTVAGLLVLLITVLVVNQLLNRRQARQRGHAVAAQAAILVAQANRSVSAVSSAMGGSGDRGAASDGFRTYMMMLLVSAPVLMDDPVARHFLEDAQHLGAVMAGVLATAEKSPDGAAASGGAGATPTAAAPKKDEMDEAARQLRRAAEPLLSLLSPSVRDSVQSIGRTAEE